MLELRKGHWYAVCDTCKREEYSDETELEAARMVMRQGGWLEMAKSGKPPERWPWMCVKCKPKPSAGFMPGTPAPPDSGEG